MSGAAKIMLDHDGIPLACGCKDNLGLPLVRPGELSIRVYCDGVLIRRCVGYDRLNGHVWMHRERDGLPVIENNALIVDRMDGVITVERRA
jgi:hypothetical protein